MGICALFVTLSPVIDRLRDRRLSKQEKKIKLLEKKLETQQKTMDAIKREFLEQFESLQSNNIKGGTF
jgi:predicted RNase H-like nuclease (RuvC/YqgF family)